MKSLKKDYRFNADYQKAIEDKKVADQKTEKLKSEIVAKVEEYKRLLERQKVRFFRNVAADGIMNNRLFQQMHQINKPAYKVIEVA